MVLLALRLCACEEDKPTFPLREEEFSHAIGLMMLSLDFMRERRVYSVYNAVIAHLAINVSHRYIYAILDSCLRMDARQTKPTKPTSISLCRHRQHRPRHRISCHRHKFLPRQIP